MIDTKTPVHFRRREPITPASLEPSLMRDLFQAGQNTQLRYGAAVKREPIPEATLEAVTRLLRNAPPPLGCYAMGILTVHAYQVGREPTLLELREAQAILTWSQLQAWLELRIPQHPQAG